MSNVGKITDDVQRVFERETRTDFSWSIEGRVVQCRRAWGFFQQLCDISCLLKLGNGCEPDVSDVALDVCTPEFASKILAQKSLKQYEVDQLLGFMQWARNKINRLKNELQNKEITTCSSSKSSGSNTTQDNFTDIDKYRGDVGLVDRGLCASSNGVVDEVARECSLPTQEELEAARILKARWFGQAGIDALQGRVTPTTTLMRALIEIYPDEQKSGKGA